MNGRRDCEIHKIKTECSFCLFAFKKRIAGETNKTN